MTSPQILVRPRVISPDTGDAVLLVDEIESLLERGVRGPIEIAGPPGSGKTSALTFLASSLDLNLDFVLRDELGDFATDDACKGPIIFADLEDLDAEVRLTLAEWTDDKTSSTCSPPIPPRVAA